MPIFLEQYVLTLFAIMDFLNYLKGKKISLNLKFNLLLTTIN